MYGKITGKDKRFVVMMMRGREKLLDPEKARRKEEAEEDQSKSAVRERKVLAEEEERDCNKANLKLMQKLKIRIKYLSIVRRCQELVRRV